MPEVRAEAYEIDPVHSTVIFQVRHLGISTVTGRFGEVSGTGTFDSEDHSKSGIEVTAKVDSIDTGNEKRDAHLRTEDFFDAAKFPNLTFKSTELKKTAGEGYELTGDLTIHGVTKKITLPLQITEQVDGMNKDEKRRGGSASFEIKRSDFGMNFMVGPVSDTVIITLSFSAIAK